MPVILRDATSDALSLSIEQNNFDLFYAAARAGSKTILQEPEISGVVSKPWWPSFLFDPSFDQDIEIGLSALRARILERGWPAVLKFGPRAKPPDLHRHLEPSGFVAMDHWPPGMAVALSSVDRKSFPVVEDLNIEAVSGGAQLRSWLGFFDAFEPAMFEQLLTSSSLRLYVGMMAGKPVGASMLFLSAGVAGLYHVEALPAFRRRGIGTALTLRPMEDASDGGYDYAVLQASTMGELVYRRIGFESYFNYGFYHPMDYGYADFLAAK